MNYLQLPYDFIAHYIGRFSRRIPNGVRRAILRGLCFVCAFYFPLKYSIGSHNILKDDYLRSYIYAAVILVFCICLSDGIENNQVWKKRIAFPFLLFAVCIVISGCIHPIGKGFLQFGATCLILLPILASILKDSEKSKLLIRIMADSYLVMGYLFFIICWVCNPYRTEVFPYGYTGITINPNFLGMIYLCCSVSSVYHLMRKHNRYAGGLMFGLSGGMILLSRSRASELVFAAVFICSFRIIRVICKEEKKRNCFYILILVCAGFLISSLLLPELIAKTEYRGIGVIREYTDSWFKNTDLELGDSSFSGIEDQNVKSSVSYHDISTTTLTFIEAGVVSRNTVVTCISLPNFDEINAYSTGRLGVYIDVIRSLNLFGHDMKKDGYYLATGTKLVGAHNTPLDFAFRCGLPAGILCLIMEVFSLIEAGRILACKKSFSAEMAFISMAVIIYVLESMIEIQVLPFTRDITFLYYLVMMPLFCDMESFESSST